MVFLATVRAMSTTFILCLGTVTDDKSPNKQSDRESHPAVQNKRQFISDFIPKVLAVPDSVDVIILGVTATELAVT